MRSWVVLLIGACLGTVIGLGFTIGERMTHEELFLPSEYVALAAEDKAAQTPDSLVDWPKAELVNDRIYDFGSMERRAKMNHTFLVKNVGQGVLTLLVVRSTCKCTISGVNGTSFKPGETAEISVEWTGQVLSSDPQFRQAVEVETNDPEMKMITFVISGFVTDTIRVFPPELTVGRVSSNTGGQTEFRLFGYRGDKIEVLETAFEEADTADLYSIDFEPLPKEEVEKEKGASCGLLAKVGIKPGLPLGPINQTIQIRSRVDKETTIYIPFSGQAVSDIIIASSSIFEGGSSLVNFGALKRTESARADLKVYVRGPHRHETQLSVGEVDPSEYLKVSIGPPEELNEGKTIRYTVTIEIPSGMEPVNHLGAEYAKCGRVVLATTHPVTKQIPIKVRFAVD